MGTFDQYLKSINPKLDFFALPDNAKNELLEFYEFLVYKYQQRPDIQMSEKHTILSAIFQEANGKLPANYSFNRDEVHER
jgi:hypothetical protein